MGSVRENLSAAGGIEGCRWPERESDLRVKRPDPWLRANAPSKEAADPEQRVKMRGKTQPRLDLVRQPVAQPPVEASSEALLEVLHAGRRQPALL